MNAHRHDAYILSCVCPDPRDSPILAGEHVGAPPGVQTGLLSAGRRWSVRGARTCTICHPATLLLC